MGVGSFLNWYYISPDLNKVRGHSVVGITVIVVCLLLLFTVDIYRCCPPFCVGDQ